MFGRSAPFLVALAISSLLIALLMSLVSRPGIESMQVHIGEGSKVLLASGPYRNEDRSFIICEISDPSLDSLSLPLTSAEQPKDETPVLSPLELVLTDHSWEGPFPLIAADLLLSVSSVAIEDDKAYVIVPQGLAVFDARRDLRGETIERWEHSRSFAGDVPRASVSISRIGDELWIVGTDANGELKCVDFDQTSLESGIMLPVNRGKVTDTLIVETSKGPFVAWIESQRDTDAYSLRWVMKSSIDDQVHEGSVSGVAPGALSSILEGDSISLYAHLMRERLKVPAKVTVALVPPESDQASSMQALGLDTKYDVDRFVAHDSGDGVDLIVLGEGRLHFYSRDETGAWQDVYSPAGTAIAMSFYGARFDWVHNGLLILGGLLTLAAIILRFRRRNDVKADLIPIEVIATFPRRLASALIDFFVVVIVAYVLGAYFMTLHELLYLQQLIEESMSPDSPLAKDLTMNLTWSAFWDGQWTIMLFAVVGYHSIAEGLWGRTLGKLFLSLEVRSIDGTRAGVLACIVRSFLRVIDIFLSTGLLAMVFMLLTPRRQRFGDLLAETVVIRQMPRDVGAPKE